MLFQATKCVVICHAGHRKPTRTSKVNLLGGANIVTLERGQTDGQRCHLWSRPAGQPGPRGPIPIRGWGLGRPALGTAQRAPGRGSRCALAWEAWSGLRGSTAKIGLTVAEARGPGLWVATPPFCKARWLLRSRGHWQVPGHMWAPGPSCPGWTTGETWSQRQSWAGEWAGDVTARSAAGRAQAVGGVERPRPRPALGSDRALGRKEAEL